jgi:site-specific DNA-methyltransferase (adenine-specific)
VGLPDEDVDVEKEVSKKADDIKVNLGDIFELGNHRLICGDGINSETFNRLLGGGGVDLLITDPPYGVSIGSKNKDISRFKKSGIKEDILNDNLDAASLRDILIQVFKNSHDKLNQGASFYVTAPQGGSLGLMMQTVMKDSGLPVNHVLIWVKNAATFSLGRLDYSYQHEPIFYGWKEGSHKFYGKNETSVWKIDKPVSSKLHPTMKPIELYARAMCNSSVEGDIILDPFGGSGTCIMAAESLNRKARVIELDPHYCSVIISRWELATGKKHKTLK